MPSRKRCPNGTRFNRKTGACETQKNKRAKCPNGTRRNKQSGRCEPPLEPTKLEDALRRIRATERIRHFFLKNKHKIRSLFLKGVCAESGQCLAFGTHAEKIRRFFGGFTSFAFLTGIKKIGASSANGLIYELKYTHQNYTSYAVLKMNAAPNTDSLLYEKLTGDTINRYSKYYPCFVETYGSYTVPKELWTKLMKRIHPLLQKKDLTEFSLDPNDSYDKVESCRPAYYKTKALLIQHIKPQPAYATFGDCLKYTWFIDTDLPFVLYQIYSVLGALANDFTHYDLHLQNVLMYRVKTYYYIVCHYHYADGSVLTFKSRYLPKIIDYGRSYVRHPDARESCEEFRKSLCAIKNCNPSGHPCGTKYGYTWLDPAPNSEFINSTKPNMSHDLRLAHRAKTEMKKAGYDNGCLFDVLDRVIFTNKYGTKEEVVSGCDEGSIHNVKDMARAMHDFIQLPNIVKRSVDRYAGYRSLGDMHIYLDGSRPVRFDPSAPAPTP